jgi:hypothetical protein
MRTVETTDVVATQITALFRPCQIALQSIVESSTILAHQAVPVPVAPIAIMIPIPILKIGTLAAPAIILCKRTGGQR